MIDVLIVLNAARDTKRASRYIRALKAAERCAVLASSPEIARGLRGISIDVRYLHEYAPPVEDYIPMSQEPREAVGRKLADCRLGHVPLKDVFSFEGMPLWGLVWPTLRCYHFDLAAKYIDIMRAVIARENPKTVVLSTRGTFFSDIFEKVGKELGVEIRYLSGERFLASVAKHATAIARPSLRWMVIGAEAIAAALTCGFRTTRRRDVSARRFLFLNTSRRQWGVLLPVIEETMKCPGNFVSLIFLCRDTMVSAAKKLNIQSAAVGGYLNFRAAARTAEIHRALKKVWEFVEQHEECLSDARYRDIPVWELLKPIVKHFFFELFNPLSKLLALAESALERERPDLVVHTDTYQMGMRCFIALAKQKGIPILRIQYAMTLPRDYQDGGENNYAVAGECFREQLLRELPRDKDKIVVTGQPRYDRYVLDDRSAAEIRRRLTLDPSKKIVLFASTHYYDTGSGEDTDPLGMHEHYVWLKTIYAELNKLKGVHILVKPHPNINDSIEMHRKVIRDLCASDTFTLFPRTHDIVELIKVSDVFVTFGSTTVLEAMIWEKPIVMVDLYYEAIETMPYVQQAVVVGVAKKEGILPAVVAMLEDREAREKIRSNQKKFIECWLYKVDGRSSARVVDLMTTLSAKTGAHLHAHEDPIHHR